MTFTEKTLPEFQHARDNLIPALWAAVPIAIQNLQEQDLTFDELREIGQRASAIFMPYADQMQFGGPKCTEAFDAFVTGLAVLAHRPYGVDMFGQHWCVNHTLCKEAA